ncbi:hypothetical protein [Massilia psychrophila]|jgi:hypothetical protein|uniref:hypothetical protein n=1 Tax=Massilia psychrophila TaxID=1603353 RepID=UPI0015D479AF|nr:hypothetical protein [Massilia psychrophila]GGE73708.1 hypothetical protein GCM10008020_17910 [Massilia psychrophila]
MATVISHRKVDIVVLDAGEAIASCCKPGDIAVYGYDRPYTSDNEALWAAKYGVG